MGEKLGQNFLINEEIVKKIVEAAELKADDLVLEIGPGKGILTEELAKKAGPPRLAETTRRREAGKVVAIEIDRNLVEMLKSKFINHKNVEIVEGDVMKSKMQKSKCKITSQNVKLENTHDTLYIIPNTDYKVVANIPYYITAPIIKKFLEAEFPPSEMILMVQKEVAERICASSGQMSILAVSVQYYAKPEILFDVPQENFEPIPEVDSAVIRISHILNRESRSKEEVRNFFRVVRAGFSAKRKTLANNLANSFHLPKKAAEEKLKAAGISPTARAQELSVEDWKKLTA